VRIPIENLRIYIPSVSSAEPHAGGAAGVAMTMLCWSGVYRDGGDETRFVFLREYAIYSLGVGLAWNWCEATKVIIDEKASAR
jgi:hypothetical protein